MNSQLVKDMYTLEEQIEEIQRGNQTLQNEVIMAYQPFVARCVSDVCKRYIHQEHDDEFSIGLIAFHEAMHLYSEEKGSSFLAFAQVIIKRKVIDYIRKEKRQYIQPLLDVEEEDEHMENPEEISIAKKNYQLEEEAWQRKQEILELSKELKQYKISFQELAEISPKHQDARESAIFVAKQIAADQTLREYVLRKKRIPIKKLLRIVPVSKKTLERNRKYILTIFVVLTGDYMYLNEYIRG